MGATVPEESVTADRPASPIRTVGTDHVTLRGSNIEDTVAFYRDLLGMPLVIHQPTLGHEETHLFFDTGDGRILTFFVSEDRPSDSSPVRPDIGGVAHLSFKIEAEDLDEVKQALDEAGYGYQEFDHGVGHSLYTHDHNGLTIELAVNKFGIPVERRGEVLALAQQKRVEQGAEFVTEKFMRRAIEELGLGSEETEINSDVVGPEVGERELNDEGA